MAGRDKDKDNKIEENLTEPGQGKEKYEGDKFMYKMDKKLSKLWQKAEVAGFNGK